MDLSRVLYQTNNIQGTPDGVLERESFKIYFWLV